VNLQVVIQIDLEEHVIDKHEVVELAAIIAESYLEPGNYIASFGYLTYKVERRIDSCVVYVVEGYGFHSWLNGCDENQC